MAAGARTLPSADARRRSVNLRDYSLRVQSSLTSYPPSRRCLFTGAHPAARSAAS